MTKCLQIAIHWEIAHWFALMETEYLRMSVLKNGPTVVQWIQIRDSNIKRKSSFYGGMLLSFATS